MFEGGKQLLRGSFYSKIFSCPSWWKEIYQGIICKIFLQINFDCKDSEFESQLRKFYFCTDIGLYKILLSFYHCFLTFVCLFGGLQHFWNAFTNRHQLHIATSLIVTFHARRRAHVNQCHLLPIGLSCPLLLLSITLANLLTDNLHWPFVSFCDSGSHCLKSGELVGSLEHVHLASCMYFAFRKIIAGIFFCLIT